MNTGIPESVEEALSRGEGQYVEFKESMPRTARDLAKEIAAFSTSDGGVILIGVANDGRIAGFTDRERVEGCLRDVDPSPKAIIELVAHGGSSICVVWVAKGDSPPYFVDGRVYVRRGSLSDVARPAEVKALVLRAATHPRFAIAVQSVRQWPNGLEPVFRLEQIGGDAPAYVEWRFRGPRLDEARPWSQVPISQLGGRTLAERLRFTDDTPSEDSRVGVDEIGLEIRTAAGHMYDHQLVRVALRRRTVPGGEKWSLGDQLPPQHWDEPAN